MFHKLWMCRAKTGGRIVKASFAIDSNLHVMRLVSNVTESQTCKDKVCAESHKTFAIFSRTHLFKQLMTASDK